jgi:hypothetical protein
MKAFPFIIESEKVAEPGMDLRDYFAAKALSVLYKQFSEFEEGFVCSEVANAAYKMADAMIEARKI